MVCYAITTSDNPYDPFDQSDSWLEYDLLMRYGTCAYLDRVTFTSDQLSDQEYVDEIERGIDNIIKYTPFVNGNPDVIYVKVSKEID